MKIKAIETFYNGYRFRSRAEARWAVFFNELKMPYLYEPEGFELSDGTCYLPDFYLPDCKTFFEVKGVMTDTDMHKIKQLQNDLHISVAIGYSDMTFQSSDNWSYPNDPSFEITDKDNSFCLMCPKCNKVFFMGGTGIYSCQCCGYYDGDSIFCDYIGGHGFDYEYEYFHNKLSKAALKARQARFDHVQK